MDGLTALLWFVLGMVVGGGGMAGILLYIVHDEMIFKDQVKAHRETI